MAFATVPNEEFAAGAESLGFGPDQGLMTRKEVPSRLCDVGKYCRIM
jgi:hypothetical protein